MRHTILLAIVLAGLGAGEAPPPAATNPTTVPTVASEPTTAAATQARIDTATGWGRGRSTEPTTAAATQAALATAPATAPANEPAVSSAATTAPTTAPVAATTAPTTAPTATTKPSASPGAAEASSRRSSYRSSSAGSSYRTLLPAEYSILNERSIFLKGHVTQFALDRMRGIDRRGSETPPGGSAPTTAISSGPVPEEALVFDGVTQADEHIVAFVEDRNAGRMNMVKVGDAIARGKVAGLSLDMLDYSMGGNVTHVQIGQNLLGVQAAPMTASEAPTTAPAADSSAPGAAPAASPGGSTSSGGISDILERLRRRRQQELPGK